MQSGYFSFSNGPSGEKLKERARGLPSSGRSPSGTVAGHGSKRDKGVVQNSSSRSAKTEIGKEALVNHGQSNYGNSFGGG
jgi:hypothetical protein